MDATNIEFFASCLVGVEQALAAELKRLRVRHVRPLHGGVAFFGCPIDAERVCLWSRVASRVTAVVGRVNAGDADLMYAGAYDLPWEEVVAPGAKLAVRAHGINPELRNTQFTALKVKDAICDALRSRTGARPDIDADNPDALIEVRVRENRATITFDVSGESLHRRSYFDAKDEGDAVLSCAHAAALLETVGAPEKLRAGWCLVDPACLVDFTLCEAAGIAADQAPGLLRERWGFNGWAMHDEKAWEDALADADERFEAGLSQLMRECKVSDSASLPNPDRVRIAGLAPSRGSVARARRHLRNARLSAFVRIECSTDQDFGEDLAIVARTAKRRHGAAVLVCHVSAADSSEDEAYAMFRASRFMSAVRHALPGSVFGLVDDRGVSSRFNDKPSFDERVGSGRIETRMQVFQEASSCQVELRLPNPEGGPDIPVEVNEAKSEQFAARLRKVARERRKWAQAEGVSCYRVYDADLPEYNAAIDVYEGAGVDEGATFVHIAEYQAPSSVDTLTARRRFEDLLVLTPAVLGVRPGFVYSKVRSRSRGGSQYRDAGKRSFVTHTTEEGLLFEIDLAGYLDTGLFLDHRITRRIVGEMARGKRFLNLFAYTGAATVHAAAGGAESTTTVDLSQTYLDWAQRNMRLNGFRCEGAPVDGRRGSRDGRTSGRERRAEHAFVRADVMPWIVDARRQGRQFDLIFVDPPTFSNSKAMGRRTWDVQRDHVELLVGVSRLLARGGEAVFSCNLRSFKPDYDELTRLGVELTEITQDTIPHDFERNARIHRCYLLRRVRPR